MANHYKPLLLKIFLFAAILQYTLPVNAQYAKNRPVNFLAVANSIKLGSKADTGSVKNNIFYVPLPSPPISNTANGYSDEALPAINAEASIGKPQERKQLMGYLKNITSDDEVVYNQSRTKFLYKLGNVFTKLRLYPLAMKCYLKTTKIKPGEATDTLQQPNIKYLAVNSTDDSLLSRQALLAAEPGFDNKKSPVTSYKHITSALDDGKKAVAYAMLFHVKQPVPGKRKIFVGGNTGHTFITLIKYNVDSTYSSFSFGFYPKKRNPLSATPLVPTASSVFKDDTDHKWDEVAGKFISKRRFEKILLLTKQYDNLEYHLSNNNCTDFGLKAARLAGINVNDTMGKWPLGHGNNPAITGQSMLEGKVTNADTGKTEGVFVNNTVVVP
jgi:tetratricopeptide (TPR) repeat protein